MEFYANILAPFVDYDFMRRALLGNSVLSVSTAPVGVFLVLRRMSLNGEAVAHAILPGAAVGFMAAGGLSFAAMSAGGFVGGLVVVLLAGVAARFTSLESDAALAALYILSLAGGVTLVALKGSNLDLLHILFGSILSMDESTSALFSWIATVTLLAVAMLYRLFVLDCVDPEFLRSTKPTAGTIAYFGFMVLVVINLVGGFLAVGTLLSVGQLVLPAIAARLWAARVIPAIGLAAVFGIAAGAGGLLLSYHLGLPTGPTIVLASGLVTVLSSLVGTRSQLSRWLRPSLKWSTSK